MGKLFLNAILPKLLSFYLFSAASYSNFNLISSYSFVNSYFNLLSSFASANFNFNFSSAYFNFDYNLSSVSFANFVFKFSSAFTYYETRSSPYCSPFIPLAIPTNIGSAGLANKLSIPKK